MQSGCLTTHLLGKKVCKQVLGQKVCEQVTMRNMPQRGMRGHHLALARMNLAVREHCLGLMMR